MASIQCRGKEKLLEYYENRGVEAWAIYDGKIFLFKGIGFEQLEQMLDMIIESGSNSCYTLKVYEDITSAKDIKKNTPEDGNLNFVLSDYTRKQPGDTTSLMDRMSLMEKKVQEHLAEKIGRILDAEEAEPEPETIGDILKNPDKVKEYLEVIGMFAGLFRPQQAIPATVGNVSRVPTGEKELEKEYTQDQQNRLINAINELERNDPDIIDHLEKLATISKTNKPLFTTMISMLKTL